MLLQVFLMVASSAVFYIDHVDALSIGISAFVFISVSLAFAESACFICWFFLSFLFDKTLRAEAERLAP